MADDGSDKGVKERLLSVAFEMLRSGDGELSSREVARRANVNAAMVNYHFGSREGLIQACVDSYYAHIRDSLVALVSKYTPDSFLQLLDSAIRETFTFMRANRALARQVLLDFVRRAHAGGAARNRGSTALDCGRALL